MDWDTTARPEEAPSAGVAGGGSLTPMQVDEEPLEHFLPIEGPSVIECFDAVEQANRASAEGTPQQSAEPTDPTRPQPAAPVSTDHSSKVTQR
jgi:hypothetical protein